MSEPPHGAKALSAEQIRTLAADNGVSEADIRMIIELVGTNRSSIIREAKMLKKSRG